MSKLWDYIKIALTNIKMNKVRSALTMLGLVIGISSVVLTISTGNGFRNMIYNTLNEAAGNSIYIICTDMDSGVTEADIAAIRDKIDNLKGVSMMIDLYVEVEGTNQYAVESATARMGTQDLCYNSKEAMISGRYFTEEEYENAEPVCVISESTAREFFGSTDVVGMTMQVKLFNTYYDVKVVGVKEDSESAMTDMLLYGYTDYVLEMPHTLVCDAVGIAEMEHSYILAYAESQEEVETTANNILTLLEARHDARGEGLFMVQSMDMVLEVFNSVLNLVTAFIVLVAMISLLVGGIGIMNIMLVSVTERTKEIGIRKALGARTRSILFQFLVEAGTISLLGGLIGIALGLLGSTGVCSIVGMIAKLPVTADYNPVLILMVALVSTGIGIFFGLYPARRAAKLTPIEALRRK